MLRNVIRIADAVDVVITPQSRLHVYSLRIHDLVLAAGTALTAAQKVWSRRKVMTIDRQMPTAAERPWRQARATTMW